MINGTGKQKRRRLSAIERESVISEAARIYTEQPIYGIKSALEKAVLVLPVEKHPPSHKITTTWPWLLSAVQNRITEGEKIKKAEDIASPPIPLSTYSTEEIISEMVSRIVNQFSQTLEKSIKEALLINKMSQDTVHYPVSPTPLMKSIKKKVVVVVGLLPPQQRIIRNEFGKEYELRFIKPKGSRVSIPKETDVVIGMTGFISHSHEDTLKKLTGTEYIRVPGGMTGLRDTLTELFVNH